MSKMKGSEPAAEAHPVERQDPGFPPGIAYVDGSYCPISEAKISVLDWGFLRSDATYDVVHVWKRRFFRLDAHLDRFLRSVEKLRLALPVDRAGLQDILMACVRRSGLDDVYVEMICTRGHAPGYGRDPRRAINTFIAFAIPFGSVPSAIAAVAVCKWAGRSRRAGPGKAQVRDVRWEQAGPNPLDQHADLAGKSR